MAEFTLRNYSIPKKDATLALNAELPQSPIQTTTTDMEWKNHERFFAPGRKEANMSTFIQRKRAYVDETAEVVSTSNRSAGGGGGATTDLCRGRDPSYPPELNELIFPLECKLCVKKLDSSHTASAHYKSKQHDRSITKWLQTNYIEKGMNPPPIKRMVPEGLKGNDAYHCQLCDLKLTSATHAQQHYAGRKHKLVASKATLPSGAGYYDASGNWVRTGTKFTPNYAHDGRFGIGESFKAIDFDEAANSQSSALYIEHDEQQQESDEKSNEQQSEPSNEQQSEQSNELSNAQWSEQSNEPLNEDAVSTAIKSFNNYCTVCKVGVTSVSQMQTHLDGAKHKKKLKLLASEGTLPTATSVPIPIPNKTSEDMDFSMFRTPTGSFYCKICDITLTHENNLKQHLSGKKHIFKVDTLAKEEESTAV